MGPEAPKIPVITADMGALSKGGPRQASVQYRELRPTKEHGIVYNADLGILRPQ